MSNQEKVKALNALNFLYRSATEYFNADNCSIEAAGYYFDACDSQREIVMEFINNV